MTATERAKAERAKFTRINRRLAARGDGLRVSKRRGGGYVLTDGARANPVDLDRAALELGVDGPYQWRRNAASSREEEERREQERQEEARRGARLGVLRFLRDQWLGAKITRGHIDRAGRDLIELLLDDLQVEWEISSF